MRSRDGSLRITCPCGTFSCIRSFGAIAWRLGDGHGGGRGGAVPWRRVMGGQWSCFPGASTRPRCGRGSAGTPAIVAFDYGQKHQAELLAAARVAEAQGAESFRVIRLDAGAFSVGADRRRPRGAWPYEASPSPTCRRVTPSFWPMPWAWRKPSGHGLALGWRRGLFGLGVGLPSSMPLRPCEPGHEDGGRVRGLKVHAPLLSLTKAEIIRWGTELGVPYHLTVSCYQASEAGLACGRCDSCRLRREGFIAAGVEDPTPYR